MKKKVLLMTLALALMMQSSVMAEATHKHKWVDDIKNSNETINRYTCECGATKDEVIADIRDYVITFDANGGYVGESEKETYKGRIKWLQSPNTHRTISGKDGSQSLKAVFLSITHGYTRKIQPCMLSGHLKEHEHSHSHVTVAHT